MPRSSCLNSNELSINAVDSRPHDLTPNSNVILDGESLLPKSADEAVAPHTILTLLLMVGRAISKRIISWYSHTYHLHCILCE